MIPLAITQTRVNEITNEDRSISELSPKIDSELAGDHSPKTLGILMGALVVTPNRCRS